MQAIMTRNQLYHFLFLSISLLIGVTTANAQELPKITFSPLVENAFSYDSPERQLWWDNYEKITLDDSSSFIVANKSVGFQQPDSIGIDFNFRGEVNLAELTFSIDGETRYMRTRWKDRNSIALIFPRMEDSYTLQVFYERQLIGELNVLVFEPKRTKIILVPLLDFSTSTDSLELFLNRTYRPARLSFDVQMTGLFDYDFFEADSLLTNPSVNHDRYTDQMIEIRDAYFERFPNADRSAYYVFIVPGFVNPQMDGYMVRNKALAFLTNSAGRSFRIALARQLGYGLGALSDSWKSGGPTMGTSENLMDTTGGLFMVAEQWELIDVNSRSVSYYDEYEDVRTNSGFVAYYFWEEDSKGNIALTEEGFLKAINRPYKQNQYALHLEISNWFFIPLTTIRGYDICLLHFISLFVLFIGSILLRRMIIRKLKTRLEKRRFLRFLIRVFIFVSFVVAFYGSFRLVNEGYYLFEKNWGNINYLNGKSTREAIQEVRVRRDPRNEDLVKPGSEILIKKGEKWFLKKRKKVLYFDAFQKNGKLHHCSFEGDSDSLRVTTKNYVSHAESHYIVVSYYDENTTCIEQRVFNHLGINVTEKLSLSDPAKRILLFVNGYRPTSLGKTFEENFDDITKNGLEFPNSKNLIYDFDRYEYWNPWNKIDEQFQKRLNPGETFYADGHFSVETSNHRSLINFTSISKNYPKRCEDRDHHTCRTTAASWNFTGIKSDYWTYERHRTRPNKNGFNLRRDNGKIAGKNLFQMLNELPNNSANDTLFIVAHSMGYAYALGMIESLRGKINFGGLYIIAPENASSGNVNMNEWQEVWQYGNDFERYKKSEPCLLDGIAPQVKAGGITAKQRLFIPDEYYTRQGFFDSHFIGYYRWILNIPENERGYIRQR